ncbi:LOW QUALITY PROTEIN: 20 kDa chaperonin, chloroplastic [Dioscorea cayenensis subsp. rotundata]|uniref:20 kDa chaperonin, chloroplastic n=1 Tax=Dioscorea cayennensis subsp. rotundata TaxID=55577 RepID=A0AB40D502_DIOCR|nr:LOW QUALITY PROTEIN: 20 kDa chaperonin, chloroplastic [Dioscorea cayenensis subsp. rotundata]
MATLPIIGAGLAGRVMMPSFDGLRQSPSVLRVCPMVTVCNAGLNRRSFRGLVVKAATTVAPKFTSVKPLDDRVLVKIKSFDEKTPGGVLLPTTAQSKPQGGEVVAVGDGRTVGNKKVEISVQSGAQVVYSKFAGTELEFNGADHILLKEDDIVGILDTDDVKDLKPLGDRVLIKIVEAEDKTPAGVLLTGATKEKPPIGTIVAVGPGPLDDEGKRKALSVTPGNTVLYSKFAGTEFKSADGSDYIALRSSDVIAVLS